MADDTKNTRFPGMKSFTDDAAAVAGVDANELASSPRLKKVGDLLAQTPGNTPEHQADSLRRVKAERAALLAELAALDAAAATVHGDMSVETAQEVAAKAGKALPPEENLAADKAASRAVNPREPKTETETEAKADAKPAPVVPKPAPVVPPTPKPVTPPAPPTK